MSNPHVLVVDDEADIRALIKDILSGRRLWRDDGSQCRRSSQCAGRPKI